MIVKNRDRQAPSFANINLLGVCNANCFFCLGKDISAELAGHDQLTTHFSRWNNFRKFLNLCRHHGIDKLYFTGQTADGLQYEFLDEAVDTLQSQGFKVGVRTNGLLAPLKMSTINKMYGGIGYSIHTLDPEKNSRIMGTHVIPDWDHIIPMSGPNVRVSIVLCRENVDEFFHIVKYLSQFPNVRYIQVRRISTDTRLDELCADIAIYESFYKVFQDIYPRIGTFYAAQQHEVYGKEVNFWRTVETSVNSFNYFTDGTISDEYFIVEGYLKNRRSHE